MTLLSPTVSKTKLDTLLPYRIHQTVKKEARRPDTIPASQAPGTGIPSIDNARAKIKASAKSKKKKKRNTREALKDQEISFVAPRSIRTSHELDPVRDAPAGCITLGAFVEGLASCRFQEMYDDQAISCDSSEEEKSIEESEDDEVTCESTLTPNSVPFSHSVKLLESPILRRLEQRLIHLESTMGHGSEKLKISSKEDNEDIVRDTANRNDDSWDDRNERDAQEAGPHTIDQDEERQAEEQPEPPRLRRGNTKTPNTHSKYAGLGDAFGVSLVDLFLQNDDSSTDDDTGNTESKGRDESGESLRETLTHYRTIEPDDTSETDANLDMLCDILLESSVADGDLRTNRESLRERLRKRLKSAKSGKVLPKTKPDDAALMEEQELENDATSTCTTRSSYRLHLEHLKLRKRIKSVRSFLLPRSKKVKGGILDTAPSTHSSLGRSLLDIDPSIAAVDCPMPNTNTCQSIHSNDDNDDDNDDDVDGNNNLTYIEENENDGMTTTGDSASSSMLTTESKIARFQTRLKKFNKLLQHESTKKLRRSQVKRLALTVALAYKQTQSAVGSLVDPKDDSPLFAPFVGGLGTTKIVV
jgi:hypothetical protein